MVECHAKAVSSFSRKPNEFVWNSGFVLVRHRNKWCSARGLFWLLAKVKRIGKSPKP